ncbi:MAG: hypothetical protein J3T61_05880 [Candidatus Brocadiales bacterium]|nr:hypothetical protein [Candidatus Bathyanammoxibius sp.]
MIPPIEPAIAINQSDTDSMISHLGMNEFQLTSKNNEAMTPEIAANIKSADSNKPKTIPATIMPIKGDKTNKKKELIMGKVPKEPLNVNSF